MRQWMLFVRNLKWSMYKYKKIPWTLQVPDEDVMALHMLVVAPDFRGRGLGEMLVRFGIYFCKKFQSKDDQD